MKHWKPFIIICGKCLRDRNHFYYHLSSQAVAQAARRAAEEEARLAEEEALLAGTCLANYRGLEVVLLYDKDKDKEGISYFGMLSLERSSICGFRRITLSFDS